VGRGGVTVYAPLRRWARPSSPSGAAARSPGAEDLTGSAIGSRSSVRETPWSAARHGVTAKVEARVLADAALDHVRRGRARYRVVLAP
jgi:D-arabinose 1-dehydrogenase-like Zn-dependent alcohol dehydrogenase